jgi:hypothetical protein
VEVFDSAAAGVVFIGAYYALEKPMIWKAMFDTHAPHWRAYGRAVFVEGDDEAAARGAALIAARMDYPDSEILLYGIGQSTERARDAFEEKKARLQKWRENAAKGIFNAPKSL